MTGEIFDESHIAFSESFETFAGPLGHIILEFNYLEIDAGRLIARLLKQDDYTATVFASIMPFLDKLKMIKLLSAYKVEEGTLTNYPIELGFWPRTFNDS